MGYYNNNQHKQHGNKDAFFWMNEWKFGVTKMFLIEVSYAR